ncbi:MAG: site-2 protease family protein [Campylobacterota bacterium]|nr:site-2 protease family protein [Campylobacterota bacterium]
MDSIDIIKIIAAVLALIVAIVGHEIMHGWVAYKYGDHTAKSAGRLSINPIIHVDLFGTILVPLMTYFLPVLMGAESGFLFGWAKPVPVNMQTVVQNGGYNAAMQVDLAGIVYNFTLAAVTASLLLVMSEPTAASGFVEILFFIFLIKLLLINVVLGVFNLLPIPQFDGAHFIMHLSMKLRLNEIANFFYRLEQRGYGMIIVIIILVTPIKDYVLIMPVQMILNLLLN